MSAALFALAGAFIGVLGTVLTELVRGRRDDRKFWRTELRSVCADLATEVSRLQDISHALRRSPEDADLQRAAREAHSRARAMQERLRLTSASVATQEAGRWLIHCVYYQWMSTQGGKGDFWQARKGVHEWMTKLYVEARTELGLEGSSVYKDPPNGLPVPGDRHK
jgi:hypothetical protein